MSAPESPPGTLDDARALLNAGESLLQAALEAASRLTEGGKTIDDHQVVTERVVYAATEARAAREVLALVDGAAAEGRSTPVLESTAVASVADLVTSLRDRLDPILDELGIGSAGLEAAFPADVESKLRAAGGEAALRAIGRDAIERRGRTEPPLDELLEQVRDSVREFAENEVAPHAEDIHRHDRDIPESFIQKMGELGYFGLSIPEEYGGHEMGNLAMILTTEELSRASLAAAGSLITRMNLRKIFVIV